jgi:NAD(P)-dependent dehydrogenase (short-subunit alcohol dehydrogenase family)
MATVLVTGANRGIGLEFCRQYRERGDSVIAACRRSSAELDALGVRIEPEVDVTSDDAINALAQRVQGVEIDLLINNAGIAVDDTFATFDFDALRRQFEVNSLGPLRVTRALIGHLAAGSRVAILSSRMGSISTDSAGGYYGYRMSKAAVNMAGSNLARDLKDRGIAVLLFHPGYVSTDMTEHKGRITPAESVRGLIAQLDRLTLNDTGTWWDYKGRPVPW